MKMCLVLSSSSLNTMIEKSNGIKNGISRKGNANFSRVINGLENLKRRHENA